MQAFGQPLVADDRTGSRGTFRGCCGCAPEWTYRTCGIAEFSDEMRDNARPDDMIRRCREISVAREPRTPERTTAI